MGKCSVFKAWKNRVLAAVLGRPDRSTVLFGFVKSDDIGELRELCDSLHEERKSHRDALGLLAEVIASHEEHDRIHTVHTLHRVNQAEIAASKNILAHAFLLVARSEGIVPVQHGGPSSIATEEAAKQASGPGRAVPDAH